MKFYKLLLLLFLIVACNKKRAKFSYQNSNKKYLVSKEAINKDDTLYTFYNFDKPSEVEMVGFQKKGFRNDSWEYNTRYAVKTITWAGYEDKYLHYKTNLFSYADSIKHGDFYTKFLYRFKEETIILNISVNAHIKD